MPTEFKPYEYVKVINLKKLSGDGDRFDTFGLFIKEEVAGPNKGMYLVRVGSTLLHVPPSKVVKYE